MIASTDGGDAGDRLDTSRSDGHPDREVLAEVEYDLSDLLEWMEAIDWSAVPTISTAEAAAWTARLIEARDAARAAAEGDPDAE